MGAGTGAGTRRGRRRGWKPVDEDRMGTGTGTGMRMGTRTRIGSGRAKERPRSARTRTRVVDAMWEKRETWVERGKNILKERVGSVAASPDNLENNKEAGGGSTRHQGLK